MKKISLLMILVCLFLIGCKKQELEREEEKDKSYQDLKEEDFDVSKYALEEIPYVFVEKLSRLDNYTKHTVGNTVATKIISYNQEIDNVYTADNNSKHLLTKSTSSLVKVYHEAYFKDDIIEYKEKEKDEFIEISYDDYLAMYGYLPYGYNLEGFDLSKDSIIEISKVEDKYHLVLNGEIGSNNVKIQMKKFGNLKDYPVFSKVEMDIKMKDEFSPIEIHFYAEYEVTLALLGKTKCVQDYIVTYTINE